MDKHGKRLALNRLIIRHKYWWFAAACCFLLCYSAGENLFNWACIVNGTNPDFRKDWGAILHVVGLVASPFFFHRLRIRRVPSLAPLGKMADDDPWMRMVRNSADMGSAKPIC